MTNKPIDEGRAHDVEGVLERLEEESLRLAGHSIDRGSVDAGIAANVADGAASLIRQLRDERDNYARFSVENSMRAFQWMAAHDALKAGISYEYPTPADVPNAIARAESAEAEVSSLRACVAELEADVREFLDRLGPRWFLECGWFPKSFDPDRTARAVKGGRDASK